jgi:hypothetical protein
MAKKRTSNKQVVPVRKALVSTPADSAALLSELRAMIQQVREGVAQAVNSALVLLYWQVGQRIRAEILKEKRAAYGKQILAALSQELVAEFGKRPI